MATLIPAFRNLMLLFALAIWGGMVFFFTFVVAPAVFSALDRDSAARLLGSLFPKYFLVQLVCIAVALLALLLTLLTGSHLSRAGWGGVALLTLALGITIYAKYGLLPRMAAAQARVGSFTSTNPTDPARLAYGQLHGQAMLLNAVAALLGAAVLVTIACRPEMLAANSAKSDTARALTVASAHDGGRFTP